MMRGKSAVRHVLLGFLTAGLLLGCSDGDLPTTADRPGAGGAISDGTGTVGDVGDDPDLAVANHHFFWLAPMVSQPDESQFGAFDPTMQPTVRVVCLDSSELSADDCDPTDADGPEVVATFTVGTGLVVETDHYKVEFDTQAYELQTSNDTDFTTYRIEVLTPPLTAFGGPFVIGLADFQLGENGKGARNLDTSETIALVDGRTLPVRFRLDEGALAQELAVNTAPADDHTGEAAFCQINCSVTVIDTDQDTEASLFDSDTGDELTAILIPANTVWTTQTTEDEGAVVHVIDELVDDEDTVTGEPCLTFGDFPTEACFRHELSPDNPNGDDFQENADGELPRAGICPEGQAVAGGAILPTWRFLKADLVAGDVVVTRPPEVDVSDFLSCDASTTVTLWDGPGGELAGSALQWLVPPLEASDFWGGQLRDLSDLFWGEDVEMSQLPFSSDVAEGTTLQVTVELLAVHPDPDQPKTNALVTFAPTAGTGALAAGTGFTDQDADPNTVTVETDGSGQATVDWEITEGSNRLEVTSPDAELASADPDTLARAVGEPAVFEVTGGDPQAVFVLADISAGNAHTCGSVPGDTIYCWGQNPFGQLGHGTTTGQLTPTLVSMGSLSLSGVSVHGDIQDGTNDQAHSCAVSSTGDIHCWGFNGSGQLGTATSESCSAGNITTSCSTTPVAIDQPDDPNPNASASFSGEYATVTTGVLHTCALDTGGTPLCWGLNAGGALGDSTTTDRSTPNDVAIASDGTDLRTNSIAVSAGEGHTCALTSDGDAYCWGDNLNGKLGDGTTIDRHHPVPVSTNQTFTAISAGNQHTCALTGNGDTYCWGDNSSGQLGDGSTTDSSTPVQVSTNLTFDAISGGGSHTCGLTGADELYCWGSNSGGQLGDGSTSPSSSPVVVSDPASGPVAWGQVEAGEIHTCALSTTGGSYCWGLNENGQLGDGSTTSSNIPVAVAQPGPIVE